MRTSKAQSMSPVRAGEFARSSTTDTHCGRRRRTDSALAAELAGQVIEIREKPTSGGSGVCLLAALMTLIAAAAFSVVLLWPAFVAPVLPSLILLCVTAVRRPRRGERRAWFLAAVLAPQALLIGAVTVWATTNVLYHTYGAVGAIGPVVVFYLSLVVAGIPCWWRRYRLAVALTLLVAAFVAVDQTMLSLRLAHLYNEAQRIIDWSAEMRQRTGEYPESLEDYPWADPGLRKYITYFGGDIIEFHPIRDANIQHGYSTSRGWYFNDD